MRLLLNMKFGREGHGGYQDVDCDLSFFDRLTCYFHAISIPNGPFKGIVECSVGWWVEMKDEHYNFELVIQLSFALSVWIFGPPRCRTY